MGTVSFFWLQLPLDTGLLKKCLSNIFGVPEEQVNLTMVQVVGISRSNQTSVCNPDTPTTYFPEVNCMHTHMHVLGDVKQGLAVVLMHVFGEEEKMGTAFIKEVGPEISVFSNM